MTNLITLFHAGYYEDILANETNLLCLINKWFTRKIVKAEREKYSGIVQEERSKWDAPEYVLICRESSRMSLLYFYSLLEEFFVRIVYAIS